MTQFVGRSGADGIAKAADRICKIDRKYHAKMVVAISLAQTALLITDEEARISLALINGITALCTALNKIADNSGFPVES